MPTLDVVVATGGGLGLFLLGMIIMTEGLRALAGDAIRGGLMRFTRTPLSGAMTGAACTTLLQSSSATTVAAVGFVAAELMSFSNALGIIFGANIGTTVTGWLVALLGFKFKLATLALPLVLLGALLRLFTRGRSAHLGFAIAGFALIFLGIDAMQQGMRGLETSFSFAGLPATGISARLQLVGIGIAFAIITQSSSATVAAALTALNTGLVDLPQAAYLVIGADVGTTVTAAIATIGASTDARRTGLSHVIYNVLTGILALLLVTPYLSFIGQLMPQALSSDREFVLVGFHTSFNVLGVVLVLPFAKQFANLVERLVKRRADEIIVGLDRALLEQPQLALSAVHRVVESAFVTLLAEVNRYLDEPGAGAALDLGRMQYELDELQDYVAGIDLRGTRGGEWARLLALIHALDHLQRLHERLEEEPTRARTARETPELDPQRTAFIDANRDLGEDIATARWDQTCMASIAASDNIAALAEEFRVSIAADMASRVLSIEAGTRRLEAVRWLNRVARHVARVSFHLQAAARAIAN